MGLGGWKSHSLNMEKLISVFLNAQHSCKVQYFKDLDINGSNMWDIVTQAHG